MVGIELLLFVGESFIDLLRIYSLVQQFADHYSTEDKITLDPFMLLASLFILLQNFTCTSELE